MPSHTKLRISPFSLPAKHRARAAATFTIELQLTAGVRYRRSPVQRYVGYVLSKRWRLATLTLSGKALADAEDSDSQLPAAPAVLH